MKKFCTFRDKETNITVSYEKRGRREYKHFTDAYAARRFYVAKFKAGRAPKVHGEKVFSQNAEKSIDILA